MAIYVGDNSALLLKNDRSVVEFYKGDQKIFGYNGSAEGEIISVGNVHPIEHRLKINLSSDTVTDFSGVSVTRYGKNLFDANKLTIGGSAANAEDLTIEADKFSFVSTATAASAEYKFQLFLPQGIYCLSGNKHTTSTSTLTSGLNCPVYVRYDGEVLKQHTSTSSAFSLVFTAEQSGVYTFGFNKSYRDAVGDVTTFSNVQLEVNSKTDYEQYKECQTVTANIDGTVDGLTSISPNMTLLSDTDSVVINCEYVKG